MSINKGLLYNSLVKYYSKNPEQLSLIRKLNIKYEGIPSLRLIDYVVVNYSKYNSTHFMHNDKQFFIHSNYRDQLKTYQKSNFDPFRRGEKIFHEGVRTTISQLNFFRWAFTNGVYDYIAKNLTTLCQFDKTSIQHCDNKAAYSGVFVSKIIYKRP